MGAITGTLAVSTPLAAKRLVTVTCTLASASDTVTLTKATHGVETIYGVIPVLEGGMDADLQAIQASYSGLVITLVSKNAAGSASTEWTSATVRLFIIAD